MQISDRGLDLIKSFEGMRLKAYKAVPTEQYYTIGYGHYSSKVKPDMVITEEQAEEYLRKDLAVAENAVKNLPQYRSMTQGQYDALVSFTYNCGQGNLKKLCNGRSLDTIGKKITLYNKAGGKVLNGLVRRREAEQKLFLS